MILACVFTILFISFVLFPQTLMVSVSSCIFGVCENFNFLGMSQERDAGTFSETRVLVRNLNKYVVLYNKY